MNRPSWNWTDFSLSIPNLHCRCFSIFPLLRLVVLLISLSCSFSLSFTSFVLGFLSGVDPTEVWCRYLMGLLESSMATRRRCSPLTHSLSRGSTDPTVQIRFDFTSLVLSRPPHGSPTPIIYDPVKWTTVPSLPFSKLLLRLILIVF